MVERTKGGENVLLGDEAGEAAHGGFPGHVALPAQRVKDPGQCAADCGQDGIVVVLHRTERSVHEAVALEEPQDDGGEQNHGTGPLDEAPAPLPGAPQHIAGVGDVVRGQLHHKGGGIAGKHSELLEHDAGNDDRRHADEIGGGGDPPGPAEDRACEQADNGHLRAAGHEPRSHNGHSPVTVLLNGTGGHDAGHAAAGGNQHGDEALAGKTEAAENAVHDEGDAGHIANILQDTQQEEQHQHLRHKAQHSADAGHDAVLDQPVQPALLSHARRAQNGVKPAGDPLAEEHVVGPVGSSGADGDRPAAHGDGVHQSHDHHEDGQCQDAVGDNLVDLVRDGQPARALAFEAGADDGPDPVVAFGGDDTLSIVVHLVLAGLDVPLNVADGFLVQVQLLADLLVPLEQFDGVPALLLIGKVM